MQDRSRVFACARDVLHAHALTPAIIFRAESGGGSRFQALPRCFVGRQSRWAGSGIPRRARVSGTHRLCIARSPETRQEVLSRPFAETRKDVAARRREYSCKAEYLCGIVVISGYSSVSVCVKDRFPSGTVIPQ